MCRNCILDAEFWFPGLEELQFCSNCSMDASFRPRSALAYDQHFFICLLHTFIGENKSGGFVNTICLPDKTSTIKHPLFYFTGFSVLTGHPETL